MEKGVKAPCEEQRSASQCDRERSRVNKKRPDHNPVFLINLRVPGRIRTDDIQNHNLTL